MHLPFIQLTLFFNKQQKALRFLSFKLGSKVGKFALE